MVVSVTVLHCAVKCSVLAQELQSLHLFRWTMYVSSKLAAQGTEWLNEIDVL